jgi:hypothetical protein
VATAHCPARPRVIIERLRSTANSSTVRHSTDLEPPLADPTAAVHSKAARGAQTRLPRGPAAAPRSASHSRARHCWLAPTTQTGRQSLRIPLVSTDVSLFYSKVESMPAVPIERERVVHCLPMDGIIRGHLWPVGGAAAAQTTRTSRVCHAQSSDCSHQPTCPTRACTHNSPTQHAYRTPAQLLAPYRSSLPKPRTPLRHALLTCRCICHCG